LTTYPTPFLNTPIEYLRGVGPQKGDLLRKELSIFNYGDLLMHYPFRYVDKTQFIKIKDIPVNGESVQCIVKIIQISEQGDGFKKRLVAIAQDDSGSIELTWFQGINWVFKNLAIGDVVIVFGKPQLFMNTISITHPELDKWNPQAPAQQAFEPVYPCTEKLKARFITSKSIMQFVRTILPQLQELDIQDMIPNSILQSQQLLPRYHAIKQIHWPQNLQQQQQATYRLKFEELFIQQMNICKTKRNRSKTLGFTFSQVGGLFTEFYNNHLPFELTDDQKKVIKEIRRDTTTGLQMNRLLQGDVGSGKTIVALLTLLIAVGNNYQACLIAPTETLAQQHFASLSELLAPLHINVKILTGSIKGKERKTILAELENGTLQLIIGTHALMQEKVIFANLGMAVIDEQHKFGVAQRASIWLKNTTPPHMLVMTATPIPRTLAMTTYGDLDVSVIEHLPAGRKPITTVHRSDTQRLHIFEFIKEEVHKGRQVYIVYPLIEESETLDYENLYAGYEQVKSFFPEHTYKLSMVHGRQSAQEREINMKRFISGDTQIMVATTVIEVGVNVPNASVMLIESAERFGLTQLHQLRGRVGRGSEHSYCILMTGYKISKVGKERIATMVQEINGFKIAEKDLELRGPGDLSGTQQSGIVELKIADLVADVAIIEKARNSALQLLDADADLQLDENFALRSYLQKDVMRSVWQKIS
jgi:ATP-dependent DNA helicase RecG